MLLFVFRLGFALLVFLIGCHSTLVGIRDGVVRGRIRSRWHRDRRELRGIAALWAGTITAITGVLVIALAIWQVVRAYDLSTR